MTQINELFPPEIVKEILKGQEVLRKYEIEEDHTKLLIEQRKKEQNAAYQKIILDRVPESIHKYILSFEYRFLGDPDKPQPSDVFDVEIPGLPRFSFKFNPELVYLLPGVNLGGFDGFDSHLTKCTDDLPVVLAKLVEIKREHDYRLNGKSEPTYEPFEEDGPNADPDVDNIQEWIEAVKDPRIIGKFIIPGGCYVVNESDLEKLVNHLIDKKLAHLNLL